MPGTRLGGPDSCRGYSPNAGIAIEYWCQNAVNLVPRSQRNTADSRIARAAAGRPVDRAGKRCGNSAGKRSRTDACSCSARCRCAGAVDSGSQRAAGGAVGSRAAHGSICVRGISATPLRSPAGTTENTGAGAGHGGVVRIGVPGLGNSGRVAGAVRFGSPCLRRSRAHQAPRERAPRDAGNARWAAWWGDSAQGRVRAGDLGQWRGT